MHVRICRDCGEEYRPEAVRCADCGGDLEDRFGDDVQAVAVEDDVPASVDLAGHRVLFLTPRAADLVPLAERLRETGLEYRLAEQPGVGEGTPSRYALLVKEGDAASALQALAGVLAPHEQADALHAAESRFDAERGYLECPACGARTAPGGAECPECGLGLGETHEPRD